MCVIYSYMDRFCPEGQKLNPWQWAIGIKSQDPALNATSSYPCGHGRNHIPTHHLFVLSPFIFVVLKDEKIRTMGGWLRCPDPVVEAHMISIDFPTVAQTWAGGPGQLTGTSVAGRAVAGLDTSVRVVLKGKKYTLLVRAIVSNLPANSACCVGCDSLVNWRLRALQLINIRSFFMSPFIFCP